MFLMTLCLWLRLSGLHLASDPNHRIQSAAHQALLQFLQLHQACMSLLPSIGYIISYACICHSHGKQFTLATAKNSYLQCSVEYKLAHKEVALVENESRLIQAETYVQYAKHTFNYTLQHNLFFSTIFVTQTTCVIQNSISLLQSASVYCIS